MTVTARPIVARTAERVTTGRSAILDETGGPPLTVTHLATEDREPGFLLAHELRVICGSLDRSPVAGGGYELNPHRSAWRPLRDVSPELITHTVRRVERCYPQWRLTLLSTGDPHSDVERFLSTGDPHSDVERFLSAEE